MIKNIIRFAISTIISSLFISIAGTQLLLSNLTSFGLPTVTVSQRLEATMHDLIHYAPLVAAVVFSAYLIAFTIAWLLSKRWLNTKFWGYLAGLTCVPFALHLIQSISGIELFYITSHLSGWFILTIGSLLGSIVFYHDSPKQEVA